MTPDLTVRLLADPDPEPISAAFDAVDWPKPVAQLRRYLAEQTEGRRLTFVAVRQGRIAGYVNLLWESEYPPFAAEGIPEISDFNVLPAHRRVGVGSALLDQAEAAAGTRGPTVGLGVGLYAAYGAAQRLYVRRGYVPDGRGIMAANRPVAPGTSIRIDDDATLMFTRRLPADLFQG
jgi:GNAT superfamily N-acetyltransferase